MFLRALSLIRESPGVNSDLECEFTTVLRNIFGCESVQQAIKKEFEKLIDDFFSLSLFSFSEYTEANNCFLTNTATQGFYTDITYIQERNVLPSK